MSGSRTGGFAVKIAATDNATPILDKINKRIAALTAPAERTSRSLAKFGEVSGINKLTEGMGFLGHNALDAFRNIERIEGPLSAITGAASLAGMASLVSHWAELGSSVARTSYRLNVPVERLGELQGAAHRFGASAEAADKSIDGLRETLYGAAWGTDPAAAKALKAIGIDAGTPGHVKDTMKALDELADKVAGTQDVHTKLRIMRQVGVDDSMLPLLNLGSAGMHKEFERQQQLGGVITDKMAADATKVTRSFDDLGNAIGGVGHRLADEVAPTVTKWMDTASRWIATNKSTADSIAKIGAELSILAGIAPAAWILRLLGLGTIAPAAAVGAGAGALGYRLGQAGWGDATGVNPTDEAAWRMAHPGQPYVPHSWWYRNMPSWMGGGPDDAAPSLPKRPADTDQLVRYFEGQGWTQQQTAGIMANYQAESGFDAANIGDNGAAAGLGQWRDDRRALYRGMYGHDPTEGSAMEQAEFTQWELTHTEKRAGDDLRGARSAADAGRIVSTEYERPRDVAGAADTRAGYAADWDKRIGQVHVEVTIKGAPAGTVATATTTGAVTAGVPRVEASMPFSR
jgi:hypothetical protein